MCPFQFPPAPTKERVVKVSMLYNQGSASRREDGLFVCEPFFGVVDGASAPYGPNYPAKMFNGMSGGELVARTIESCAYTARKKHLLPLSHFVDQWDGELALAQEGVPLLDAAELAGATFAIAKVGEKWIDILQGGDCFALWRKSNGAVGITRNQVRLHDEDMNSEIKRLLQQVAQEQGVELKNATPGQRGVIRGEMWNRFCVSLREARRQDVNTPNNPRGYALLNGQRKAKNLWFSASLRRDDIQELLLFSDGMVPWAAMVGMTDHEVAKKVMADFLEGGLPHLLHVARGIERHEASVNYTDSAEATAISIEF